MCILSKMHTILNVYNEETLLYLPTSFQKCVLSILHFIHRCKLQPQRKALPLTRDHAGLATDNFRETLRCLHVTTVCLPSRGVSEQDVYLCAAVLASSIPALCIHERTGVMPLVRGSSFMVKAPRGRLSWMENM